MHILKAGAIPFRRSERGLEFLLVTTKKGNWIFPKGFVDPGETPEEAACKEVREEAGVVGDIVGDEIGSYEDSRRGDVFKVVVFLLEYRDEIVPWEEAHKRDRNWWTPREACSVISKKQRPVLEAAVDLIDHP
jgi:8-oxo-dGTP pyrophosphatase MutT (NUDIX family)